jgi:eukaryotic-like serine/threonine-protein kinase
MKTLQVGDVVSDYRVIGVAGSGGMGTVFKIEHLITKRVEAMKLLPAGLSAEPEQVHRFEREIQVQARLHHANIVELYNAVRDGDSIALVMEFVEGDSLQRMIAAGPLPVETAVNFAAQVLSALAYAHQAGVIHRDVSPANIIVTPGLVAKLSDFGLALGATDLRLSTTGVALGSPWYMSPEQVVGLQELDARTDVYALGAVLHEMLTGRKLFEAEGAFAMMRAHVELVPQPPSSLNPKVPSSLDAIVGKAVAKDPALRFQSADEFRIALQRCAAQAATASRAVSPRKARLAGVAEVLAAVPSHFRGVHISRNAVLMAVVPIVLAAGLFAVRFSAPAKHEQPTIIHTPTIAVPRHEADRPSPLAATPVEREVPAIATPVPAEAPVVKEALIPAVLPRAKSPTSVMRRTTPAEPDTALRITGGEPPPSFMPAPRRDPAPAIEAPEPSSHNAISAEVPEAPAPAVAESVSEPAAAPQAAATPQNGGNRLVRALGKVNPFRRQKKNDSTKPDQFKRE